MNLLSRAIALGLVISIRLCAEYGCMDTSYHLAQLNDPKTYHHVTGADGGPCSCPCSKYCAQYRCSLARGQCPVCMHYRVPRPFIIAKGTKESQELRTAKAIDQYKFPFMRIRPTTKHSEKTQP